MDFSKIGNNISSFTFDAAISGGSGYLATWAFTTLNPIMGFVFGVSYRAAGIVVDPVFNTEGSTGGSQFMGAVVKTCIAAAVAANSIGAAFTLKTAFTLGTAVFIKPVVVIVGCTLVCYALFLGIKAHQDRREIAAFFHD